MGAMNRVVIVASRESYRTGDFLAAAALLRAEAVVASDAPPPFAEAGQIAVDLDDPSAAAATIANLVPQPDAVIAIDDQGAAVAAEASRLLGLAHNPQSAVAAADAPAVGGSRSRPAVVSNGPTGCGSGDGR